MSLAPPTASETDSRVGLQAIDVGMTLLPATYRDETPHTSLVGPHTEVPSSSGPMRVLPW
jgi:hypothetical protein